MKKVFHVSHVLQAKETVFLEGEFLPDAKFKIGDVLTQGSYSLQIKGIATGLRGSYPKKEIHTLQAILLKGDAMLLGSLLNQPLELST